RSASCRARARAGTPRPRAVTGRRPPPAAPRPRAAPPGRSHPGGLERAPAVLGGERLRELADVAVEHLVERVHGPVHAAVRDAVLREVVGADLLGALPGADL